jgi:hypothetical protein
MTGSGDQTTTAAGGVPTQSSTEAELTRLRAQVAELQSQVDPRGRRPGGWWRPWVAGVLIAMAALLAPVAVVAAWAHDQISDTDRYVETITPLADDPAVQKAIVDRITTEIFTRLDVQAVTTEAVDALADQGLPPTAAATLTALSGTLADSIESFVTDKVRQFVESPEFADAWVAANREAHVQMVALLTGKDTEKVTVTGNAVQVNLAAVINAVKARLVARGFELADRLPEVNATFTVFESADLTKAQNGFRLLSSVSRALPVLALLLAGLAVYISRERRRALMYVGVAVAGSMLLLGAGLNAARAVYLDAVPPDQLSPAAAASIYDTLVEFIRLNLRAVLVVALAVAVGAWLSGRSSGAIATRGGIARGFAAVRGGGDRVGLNTGPVGAWVHHYRTALRAVVIGGGVLVYVQAAHPTGAWTLKVLGVVVLLLLVVELLARPPDETAVAAGPDGGPTASVTP